MRRAKFLIKEVRRSTGNTDDTAKTDYDILNWLNRAQRSIQRIITSAMTETNPFCKTKTIDLVSDQRLYDLPLDIFAQADIIAVEYSSVNNYYFPLRFITPKEKQTNYGYYIVGKQIGIIPMPKENRVEGLRITYSSRLPVISKRLGKVSAFASGTSITVTDPAGFEIDITEIDDFITLVDADGNFILDADGNEQIVEVDAFDTVTGVILTGSTFVNLTTDHYVVVGRRSTSHPQLPEACEDYLLAGAENKLFNAESSTDVNVQSMFTMSEKKELIDLFQNNIHDAKYPPIVDSTYVGV